MSKTNKSPSSKTLKDLGTKTKIINFATREGWEIRETRNVVWVGNAKCTFNSSGKLLMVE